MKQNSNTLTAKTGKRARQKESIVAGFPDPVVQQGEFKRVPVTDIDPSPFNHRKIFPVRQMGELAASVAIHGIIENLVVRLLPSGRYELVAGERRFRAAKMIGLTDVPAIIRELTDEQVWEIQLAENLQRENPHPLEEADAINDLQIKYKTLDEVAARLGKSKTFVYSRLKLLTLVLDIRAMFIDEKLTLQQVMEITSLSPESQQELYNEYCSDWRQDDFEMPDLSDILGQFRYDLSDAPFNTKDKSLLPDIGTCTKCPHNTATIRSLFPEMDKNPVCTNTGCYKRKCNAHVTIGLRAALLEHQPAALLFYGGASTFLKTLIAGLPEAAALPQYNYYGVTILREPELPQQEDYTVEVEEPAEGEDSSQPDTDGFAVAMDEYNADLEEYRILSEGSGALKGLLITEREYKAYVFSPELPGGRTPAAHSVTAAEVQTAIKSGAATPELLRTEISRIETREVRAKQLDAEKVQLRVHETFRARIADPSNCTSLTPADQVAMRLLIFQSLDYSATDAVRKALVLSHGSDLPHSKENFYDQLSQLTDAEFSYLVRMALAGKLEANNPCTTTGYFLYRVAAESGVDTSTIEQEQSQVATTRRLRQMERIEGLENKIGELQSAA